MRVLNAKKKPQDRKTTGESLTDEEKKKKELSDSDTKHKGTKYEGRKNTPAEI